jgi:hypothetical protein
MAMQDSKEWDARFLLELGAAIGRRLADDPPPVDSPVGLAAHRWASTLAAGGRERFEVLGIAHLQAVEQEEE